MNIFILISVMIPLRIMFGQSSVSKSVYFNDLVSFELTEVFNSIHFFYPTENFETVTRLNPFTNTKNNYYVHLNVD